MGVGRHLHGSLGLREGAMWRERIGWEGGGVGVGLGLGGGWGALHMAVSCCVSVKKGGGEMVSELYSTLALKTRFSPRVENVNMSSPT